jgi:hypothetical protein
MSNYLILKDYNCDGIVDMFDKGSFGVKVSKGYYQNNELKFTFERNLFYQGMFGSINVYVQPGDIPSIIDIDRDGDLDIFAFDVLGSKITFYKNLRVEDGLHCDSLRFINADDCWGKFYQNLNKTHLLNISCKGITSGKKVRHSGNCLLHIDMNGDLDYDLLLGGISFTDIQYLENGGSLTAAQITAQDTNWNTNTHQLDLSIWPASFLVDINNDGNKDILITPHLDNLETANYNCVGYYKNLGTDASPNFVWQHDSLLTPDMIDVGAYSFPTVYDYDKDGKTDLFIGTEGKYNNITHLQESAIAYYRNTSTLNNTSFELVTSDFLNIKSKNYYGVFPTFGDITGDGIDDLIMGHVNGSISLYKNIASSNTIPANFVLETDSMPNVYTSSYGAPCVFDFNEDGKTDLLIGNKEGRIYYYEDTSSTTTKKLFLKTISLGNIKVGSSNQFYTYCVPSVTKMDNTQKKYLVVGNINGTIGRYDSFINNFVMPIRKDSNYSTIQTQARSVPAIADFDGDGKYEMVVGHRLGGLNYYKQLLTVTDTTASGVGVFNFNEKDINIYPNPTNDKINILLDNRIDIENLTTSLYDLTGRKIINHQLIKTSNSVLDIHSLRPGIYFLILENETQKIVKKIVKK